MHTVILHSENFHVFYTLILYISSEYMFLLSKTTLRYGASQVTLVVKNRLAMQETKRRGFALWVGKIPGGGHATHSGVLAWRIPWTEEPGGLGPMGSHRVRHDLANAEHRFIVSDRKRQRGNGGGRFLWHEQQRLKVESTAAEL